MGAPPPDGVRFTRKIFEILPYWPKYSAERNVGMSWRRTADQILRARYEGMLTYFFLGKSRTDSNDINYIALYNAYIGEMTPTKGIQFFAFTLALFLLLRQALVAIHEC